MGEDRLSSQSDGGNPVTELPLEWGGLLRCVEDSQVYCCIFCNIDNISEVPEPKPQSQIHPPPSGPQNPNLDPAAQARSPGSSPSLNLPF